MLKASALPVEWIDQLRCRVADLHREVVDKREKRRHQNIRVLRDCMRHYDGDFVLWPRDVYRDSCGLAGRAPFKSWKLPHAFAIHHRLTNKRYVIDGSRLKFHPDSSLEVNDEGLAHVGNQAMVLGARGIT
ncbi:hypothetical protein PHMEG_00010360 [Phytophthora megakarya]|uniref:Uncharacterized protein n=1 Tax=Phytophthora megakarya TaxID=4795 RepID=A0A225WE86_9STRA|nr:hypothetical protein PHMEG_00010360 [Phytophthora megakarya]